MSERIVKQRIDDIDGNEIADGQGERVEFALRGVSYQIDLSYANSAKLDKALKPFVESAQKVGPTPARRSKVAAGGPSSKEHLAAIRDWARKHGHTVSDRGRIKSEVVDAFEAAH